MSRRGEGGYVLALAAVALVPLVGVAAIAVDLAVWQARGAVLQRAADAAALAAVPAAASPAEALQRARVAAAANGVAHGEAGVSVALESLGAARVRVTISDPAAPRVFSLPFLSGFGLQRTAEGEWAEPVSLGNPRNYLGTGSLAGNPDPHRGLPGVPVDAADGYWLAINGPCASREQGDLLTAVSEGNFVSPNPPAGDRPWRGCTSDADAAVRMRPAEELRPHRVGIRVPDDYAGGPFTVQLFDAAHCTTSPMDTDAEFDPSITTFTLLDADAPVEDPAPGTTLATRHFVTGGRCSGESTALRGFACGSGSWAQRWCNLVGVDSPTPGAVYELVVSAGPVLASARHGVNGYGVRVIAGPPAAAGTFTPCSSDPLDPAVTPDPTGCVAVEGRQWLSVTTTGGGDAASFSLAGVGPEHAGSTMEVLLFDIGEGSDSVALLDPSGAAVGFRWEVTTEPGDVPPTGGTSGVVAPGAALDVGGGSCGGGHPQRGTGRLSGSKYNDRLLRLTVTLPDDPAAQWGNRQWWRVRYRACGSRVPTDRTSWAVWVDGQPVRLIG